MKNVTKKVRMFLICLQWFFRIDSTELAVRETWCVGFPLAIMPLEDTFANRELVRQYRIKGRFSHTIFIFVTLQRSRSRYGKMIILMSMPTPENIITGIIGRIKAEDRPVRTKEIIDACAVSTWVPITGIIISGYRSDLLNYNNATTSAARKATWRLVYLDLKALLSAFQLVANANQPNAILILESGKFRIKGVSKKQRQIFSIANGVDSGTLDLTGNLPLKGSCLHDWWISVDLGKTYIRLDPTLESVTQVTGLLKGAEIFIRHQYITRKGKDNGPLETLSKVVQ